MSLQQSQTSSIEHPGERNGSEMRLHAGLLLIARISWVVVTVLILTLNVVMIPRYNAALLAHSERTISRAGHRDSSLSLRMTREGRCVSPYLMDYLCNVFESMTDKLTITEI